MKFGRHSKIINYEIIISYEIILVMLPASNILHNGLGMVLVFFFGMISGLGMFLLKFFILSYFCVQPIRRLVFLKC